MDHRIQLIGGTQVCVVYRDRLKLCYRTPLAASPHTPINTPSVNSDGYTAVPAYAQDDPPNPPSALNITSRAP